VAFRFEGLNIWQKARAFVGKVCFLTEKFPRKEDFALTAQVNRAVYSIVMNIAEGSGRNSSKEFMHFLDIAIGSLFEVISGLILALDKGYITQGEYNNVYSEGEVLGKSINSFKKTISK
jgi:four helix bundle protein